MIKEPDRARINLLARTAGEFTICEKELDKLASSKMGAKVGKMAKKGRNWVFVVKLSRERPTGWWVRGFMEHFRNGLSTMVLSDGRLCVATWKAQ